MSPTTKNRKKGGETSFVSTRIGIQSRFMIENRLFLRTTTKRKKITDEAKPAPMIKGGEEVITLPAPCRTATSTPIKARQIVIVLCLSGTKDARKNILGVRKSHFTFITTFFSFPLILVIKTWISQKQNHVQLPEDSESVSFFLPPLLLLILKKGLKYSSEKMCSVVYFTKIIVDYSSNTAGAQMSRNWRS